MIVLLVGGPRDGEWVEVRDRRAVVSAMVEEGGRIVPLRYEIERIAVESDWFFIGHPAGTKPRETVARLIAGYRGEVVQ